MGCSVDGEAVRKEAHRNSAVGASSHAPLFVCLLSVGESAQPLLPLPAPSQCLMYPPRGASVRTEDGGKSVLRRPCPAQAVRC